MLFRRLGAEQKVGCRRRVTYGNGSAASLTLSIIAVILTGILTFTFLQAVQGRGDSL